MSSIGRSAAPVQSLTLRVRAWDFDQHIHSLFLESLKSTPVASSLRDLSIILDLSNATDQYLDLVLEEFEVVGWADGFTNLETFTLSCAPVPRLAGKLDWREIRVYSRETWGSRCPSLKRIELFGIDA